MKKEIRENESLPGFGLRLLSFVPGLNWIALLWIGKRCSSVACIICGALYGIFTCAVPSLAAYLWIVALIQYAVVYQNLKRSAGTPQTPNSRENGPAKELYRSVPDKDEEKEISIVKSVADRERQPGLKERAPSSDESYADVVLAGEEEKKQSIPLRAAVAVEPKAASIQVGRASYTGGGLNSKFIEDMKKFADRSGQCAPFVPFMQYWPTYDSMNEQQQAWYFYWRTEVKIGNYPDTDLSYIFVHVYELLSGCGWQEAQSGYDQLMALWMAYRERHPPLDRYLFGWTFDFALLHNLKYSAPDIADIPLPQQPTVLDLLIDQHREDRPLKLSFALIDALCDYSLVGSKFYKDGHQLLMQEAIPRIVALADAALVKKKNRGILAVYGPNRTRKRSYCVLQSAVCSDANRRLDLSVKAYTSSQKLRGYVNELVRYGENVLRGLYRYRGRLRGMTLDEETAHLVEAFLQKEYAPAGKMANPLSQKAGVKLDFDSIDVLRAQSNAVRDALEVPEEVETRKETLTDLQEVMALFAELSPEAKALLDMLHDHEWECVLEPEMMPVFDEINQLSNRYVACALLVQEHGRWIVEDDYRDELDYIYANRLETEAPAEPVSAGEKDCFDLSMLSAEVRQCVDALNPVQKEVLHMVLSQEDVRAALEQMAEAAMTMPEILIDEINDVAAQFLDDILIDTLGDTPYILEQYELELKRALK